MYEYLPDYAFACAMMIYIHKFDYCLHTYEYIRLSRSHWFLVVICYLNMVASPDGAGNLPPNQPNPNRPTIDELRKSPVSDPGYATNAQYPKIGSLYHRPLIIVFDSFRSNPSRVDNAVRVLRQYLQLEYSNKSSGDKRSFSEQYLPFVMAKPPRQKNMIDCGVYLLCCCEYFVTRPLVSFDDEFLRNLDSWWFDSKDVRQKRNTIREVIRGLKVVWLSEIPDEPAPAIKLNVASKANVASQAKQQLGTLMFIT